MSDKITVLVAAMNQDNFSLIEKMRLNTPAVIGNQCNECSNKYFNFQNKKYVYINRTDRGISKNRNEALAFIDSGIVTFADEDMIFVDNYDQIIKKAFAEVPDADGIIFNLNTIGYGVHGDGRRVNKKIKRIRKYNVLNYGVTRLSVKATSIKCANIVFHEYFGSGSKYCQYGEDSIFLMDMLKKGLKIYSYPIYIADTDQTSSTWFNGYDNKFLYDKGFLFYEIFKNLAILLCIQDLIRHPYLYRNNDLTMIQALKIMRKGIYDYKKLKKR